ncbi:MAG: hypothetical protein QOF58_5639 [Pseudonocardiales bacterium]|jgi:hypothetical protein|nr:hypothetical protein [Pseudonocardiales bacterium]
MIEFHAEEPERLRRAECAAALRIPALEVWLRHRFGNFALPAGADEHGWYWYLDEVYRWAAATGSRRLVHMAPLGYWPTAREPAAYWGTHTTERYVVQMWGTVTGMIGVVWKWPGQWFHPTRDLFDVMPDMDTFVMVQGDFGSDGPGLATMQRRDTGSWEDFAMHWQDLARVLGRPAPYWPLTLRIEKLITAWQPGAATVTYPAICEVDAGSLLRLAATLPVGTPAFQALLQLVIRAQHGSTESALMDLDILRECLARTTNPELPGESTTTVAAVPLPVPDEATNPHPGEAVLRAGWMDILGRTDQLAADCVREAVSWDGGKLFPHASVEEVDPAGEFGAEWFARLDPVTERRAVYQRLGDGEEDAFVDPECDAPVVRKRDGTVLVVVPQRLPTTEPLAEVVLDLPIWIRTADGTLYPAPRNHYYGLNWGYGGSGPGALAVLIHRLLHDITAPGVDNLNEAPLGLYELTELKWPRGTVLTRAVLEAARDGLPYDRPKRNTDDEDQDEA